MKQQKDSKKFTTHPSPDPGNLSFSRHLRVRQILSLGVATGQFRLCLLSRKVKKRPSQAALSAAAALAALQDVQRLAALSLRLA